MKKVVSLRTRVILVNMQGQIRLNSNVLNR